MFNSVRYTLATGVALASPTNYAVCETPIGNEAPIEIEEAVDFGEVVQCSVDIEADALFAEPLLVSGVPLQVVKPPRVTLRDYRTLSIPEWDVSVETSQDAIYQLRRAAMRQFVNLQRRVKMSTQSEKQRRTWHSMLNAIDYATYSAYDMPYRWATGLLEYRGTSVRVRWYDGGDGVEILSPELTSKFELVDEGEEFVARVKTIHRQTIDLDRIAALPQEQAEEDDLSWIV